MSNLAYLMCFYAILSVNCLLLSPLWQAEHLCRKGQALTRQGSLDLDVPEERGSKRGTLELMEGERLDDLETCMVSFFSSIFSSRVLPRESKMDVEKKVLFHNVRNGNGFSA